MIVRFGYVAMSMVLKNCSPSRTVTATNLEKIKEQEVRISKLLRLARENLHNTQRLLYHNSAHDIFVYRVTSRLIPLATHPFVFGWDWMGDLKDELKSLGDYITKNSIRVSAHPDHFTLLNSPREEVLEKSLEDLEYHNNIFTGMGLDGCAKLVIHVGGLYGDKNTSAKRFVSNFNALPSYIKERITLENDDKIYTAGDVLDICRQLCVPMVLDIHHDWCNSDGTSIDSILEDIFDTWKGQALMPKIHVSSPKGGKNFRGHADYIDPEFFLGFLDAAKKIGQDFDVMIEAKDKDLALFKLMEDMKSKKWIKILNQASIEC
jgi:UV DNA damage endonuclease